MGHGVKTIQVPGHTGDNSQESKFSDSPEGSHQCKVLGLNISNGLSWNSHRDRITTNAKRTLGFIKKNIKTKNQKLRETAYNTLVRPELEYAADDKILQLE